MRPWLSVVGAAAGVLACAPSGAGGGAAKVNDPADLAAIAQVRADWQAAYNAGDTVKLATFYTSDAHDMSNGQPSATGGAGAAATLARTLSQMSSASLEITAEKTEAVGDLGYDRGTFKMSLTPKGGAAMTEEGRYLVILRKQADGSWKIAEGMSNLPTAPMPPAAPAKGS